jgi:hypothetical protein
VPSPAWSGRGAGGIRRHHRGQVDRALPQAEAAVIERLGRYGKTVSGQLTLLLPFVDKIRAQVDLRERVVSFPHGR